MRHPEWWISNLRWWHNVCMHGMAPAYLNQLLPVSSSAIRSTPPSVVIYTLELFVPSYRLTTIGRRSFPVATAIVCMELTLYNHHHVATCRQWLKTFLQSTVISRHHHIRSWTSKWLLLFCIQFHWLIDWLKTSSRSLLHAPWSISDRAG